MPSPLPPKPLRTVRVPEAFAELFRSAEDVVSRYFHDRKERPEEGTIEIFGERYILVRAASLSVEFFSFARELYGDGRGEEADEFARNILFDLAHAIGRKDAKRFHQKMGLTDPIARLSAGPIHFAYAGWAHVDILPESRPSPDESCFMVYEHPYSFESDAWLRAGSRDAAETTGSRPPLRDFPVCIMNAGYSSGWCQESFGVELVAAEVRCRARGESACRFVMAPPSRIEEYVLREGARTETVIPDLFARKRAEEELRRAHAELERRVAERTAALATEMEERRRVERELHQQRKLEALGRLAGGVAHDFNNLVAVVLTNATLLDRTLPADDPRRRNVEEIQAAGKRAAGLTRQLLAFGRSSQEGKAAVDVVAIVEDLGRMLQRLIGDDVRLELDLAGHGASVLADRSELEQIVVNLVVNARDAMPLGGLLAIETGLVLEGDGATTDRLFLEVRDSGSGIDEATLGSIFDPFFTTKPGGTGLGLSTVYGIVQGLGGDVRVDSRVGEGSVFRVTLPLAASDPVDRASDPFADLTRGGGELVLLVEDQDALRIALTALTESIGYEVRSFGDPIAALTWVEEGGRPDVLFTDLMMPHLTGAELAARVEAIHPAVRVLFMSGNPSDTLDDRRRAGRPAPFLAKPFAAEALAEALRTLIHT